MIGYIGFNVHNSRRITTLQMYAYYQVINRHETLKKLRCTIVGNRPIRNPTSPPMTQVRIYMRTNVPVKQDDDMIMMMIH